MKLNVVIFFSKKKWWLLPVWILFRVAFEVVFEKQLHVIQEVYLSYKIDLALLQKLPRMTFSQTVLD